MHALSGHEGLRPQDLSDRIDSLARSSRSIPRYAATWAGADCLWFTQNAAELRAAAVDLNKQSKHERTSRNQVELGRTSELGITLS